ncbi:MAG: formylglycine-generating enzyme family protein, partial [Chloroflexi bacterium]|nr:formylglycine-generating enzyme family protein [Chloroflexota bacterium]
PELCNFDGNVGDTTPVGRYSPGGDSPYGGVDMSGNVWEWTESLYEQGKDWRVRRGGSWDHARNYARAAFRSYAFPDSRNLSFGFRVVVVRRPPSHHDL